MPTESRGSITQIATDRKQSTTSAGSAEQWRKSVTSEQDNFAPFDREHRAPEAVKYPDSEPVFQHHPEYNQYSYDFNQAQQYTYQAQAENYGYGSRDYQAYGQQEHETVPTSYQDYSQPAYTTSYQGYNQQTDYGHGVNVASDSAGQQGSAQTYGEQPGTVFVPNMSQYGQANNYDQAAAGYSAYQPQYTPSASDQYYASQSVTEPYTAPPRPLPPTPSSSHHVAPPARPPAPPSPQPVRAAGPSIQQQPEVMAAQTEEDAWTQFKRLTEKASIAVKSTEEKLKELSETTAAKDIKDESYLAQIGGSQAYVPEEAFKQVREQQPVISLGKTKKKEKPTKPKKVLEPELTAAQEDDMDRAAMELAMKMASTRIDLQDWKPPSAKQDNVLSQPQLSGASTEA
ncbi:unnamed protein product [Gongylonema pulchrum]|uniref:Protein transport protein sec16 n=1 Tax=Gongylonema pulchrum TaxID=637853 RepID=A0A183CVT6_9BILA|nr:unnamed protein product [Gongylonema pulchrum]